MLVRDLVLLCGGAGVGSGLIGALLDGAQVAAASKVGAGRSLSRRWSHPITSVNVSVWCLIWEDFSFRSTMVTPINGSLGRGCMM